MSGLNPIQTEYGGYKFRSRLEARWAVFFDECNVEWEYEPEGYELPDGTKYLPDFLLHIKEGRAKGDVYAEVKGVLTAEDEDKIKKFVYCNADYTYDSEIINKLIILGNIPREDSVIDMFLYDLKKYDYFFNFVFIDNDWYHALPGISHNGNLIIDGDQYIERYDEEKTINAYRKARQARFEHGETPCGKF